MKKVFALILFLSLVCFVSAKGFAQYKLLTPIQEKDPSKTAVYQLDNGLTVYLSVNHLSPQIQSRIVVRAGAKDEPMQHTGMAHYLEHLMFKGSENLGTKDYQKESEILSKIDQLYAQRCLETDSQKRAEIYQKIDQLSIQANEYTLMNEYDRALTALGVFDMNAYTSTDCTVYISGFPSNQLERFLTLEYDRFRAPVFRGFQSELETVFEEWNMSQDNDMRRVYSQILKKLYKGTRLEIPVIGTAKDLQNPSPLEVMAFYKTFYVPSNMCIVLAGDLDTEKTLNLLAKTLGKLPADPLPNRPLQKLKMPKSNDVVHLTTQGQPMAYVFWRFKANREEITPILNVFSTLLQYKKAGKLESMLVTPKKVSSIQVSSDYEEGYATISLGVTPLPGVTAQEGLIILDSALADLKKMVFNEAHIHAIVAQIKLDMIQSSHHNSSRASDCVNAFVNYIPWQEEVDMLDKMQAVKPVQINHFMNHYLTDSRYVFLINKGVPKKSEKLLKPQVTPLQANRIDCSVFLKTLLGLSIEDIKPFYDDFTHKIKGYKTNRQYVKNELDESFTLQFKFPRGSRDDERLGLLSSYLNGVGTQSHATEALKEKMFALGGSYTWGCGEEMSYLTIRGLHENRHAIVTLALETFFQPQNDSIMAKRLGAQMVENRANMKNDPQHVIMGGGIAFLSMGDTNPIKQAMSDSQLLAIESTALLELKNMLSLEPVKILLYAPDSTLLEHDGLLKILKETPPAQIERNLKRFNRLVVEKNKIFLIDMPHAQQIQILRYMRIQPRAFENEGNIMVFNQYYGESMSSITFQALRERQSLCYACVSSAKMPDSPNEYGFFVTYLSTQNHKLIQAVDAMINLGFPIHEAQIQETKKRLLQERASNRIWGFDFFNQAYTVERFHYPIDFQQQIDTQIESVTPASLKRFYDQNIANKPASYCIVGDLSQIDIEALSKFGTVEKIKLDSIYYPKE